MDENRPRIFATKTNNYQHGIVCLWLISLCACSPIRPQGTPTPPESSIYLAEGVAHKLIQFIWLEIPAPIEPGLVEGRLFLAKSAPPEPIIPNATGLKCSLASPEDFAALGPESVHLEFGGDGTFSGNYTYRACPECIECYMNWDYTLEMTGVISGEKLALDIAVIHIGLNVQGSYLNAELEMVSDPTREPQIQCNGEGKCSDIQFVRRGD